MGGRGSSSIRGGGSASLGALKAQEKKLDAQVDKLKNKLADYASKYRVWELPQGYYDTQRKRQTLEEKRRAITNKIVEEVKKQGAAERVVEKTSGKTFVNSFGEATKREITTSTYKNNQAKLSKEIMGLVGGAAKSKKGHPG